MCPFGLFVLLSRCDTVLLSGWVIQPVCLFPSLFLVAQGLFAMALIRVFMLCTTKAVMLVAWSYVTAAQRPVPP